MNEPFLVRASKIIYCGICGRTFYRRDGETKERAHKRHHKERHITMKRRYHEILTGSMNKKYFNLMLEIENKILRCYKSGYHPKAIANELREKYGFLKEDAHFLTLSILGKYAETKQKNRGS
jgi:transposase-like protein